MKARTFLLLLAALLAASVGAPAAPGAPFPDLEALRKMSARFSPTPMRVDLSTLAPGDRQALSRLIEAAAVIDDIFLEQVWSGNPRLLTALRQDESPLGRARLHYFWINKGPWSMLDDSVAFLPDVPPRKLPGANFYPEDMTREEFETWVKALPPAEQDQARGFFTVIRRNPEGELSIVRYSQEYRPRLERLSALLGEAADLTPNASLQKFLRSRAAAFLSDDYLASDVDWMDLDSPLDVTIGPYETYNDEIFGYKAAFEAYVVLRDEAETAKVATFTRHLQEIENHLPEDPQYRNPRLGAVPVIRVGNEIISAGDGNHGVQTAAFNLPNDVRVTSTRGTKRVMLKNIQEAKFSRTLLPISRRVLSKADQAFVSFDSFFTHILTHELMHGLGPRRVHVEGRESTPRQALKELYSAIEEAKADVAGLFALRYMLDNAGRMGLVKLLDADRDAPRRLYTTYLASAFRSLRFGIGESHARGMALQLNYLLDRGAILARPDGTFSIDYALIDAAVRDLTGELLTIEAHGDHAAALKMLQRLAVVRPAVQRAVSRLQDIPVDLEPTFETANEVRR